jgi:hypothetical protein
LVGGKALSLGWAAFRLFCIFSLPFLFLVFEFCVLGRFSLFFFIIFFARKCRAPDA